MKRILNMLFTGFLCCAIFACAYAEAWKCEECGTSNTSYYCGNCGAAKDLWTCANCEQENGADKCTKCGITKDESRIKELFSFTSEVIVYRYGQNHPINIYIESNAKEFYTEDYSNNCKLHPFFSITNTSDASQQGVVSAICNGETFNFDSFSLDAQESDYFCIHSVCLEKTHSPYNVEWLINGVRVSTDEYIVSEGTSDLFDHLQSNYLYSTRLVQRNTIYDKHIDYIDGTAYTSQLNENEQFALEFYVSELKHSYDNKVYEIDAVLNDEECVYWLSPSILITDRDYIYENLNYKNGLNTVVFYINGIEVLHDTFEIVINTE